MLNLVQAVEQFIYTHAPNMVFRSQLLDLVRSGEKLYVARIEELEHKLRLNQDAGEVKAPSVTPVQNDSDPMTGTRYAGLHDYDGVDY